MSDDAAIPEELTEARRQFPHLLAGRGPETGTAGDLMSALRVYFSGAIAELEEELGAEQFHAFAGEALCQAIAEKCERMLAWVAERDADGSRSDLPGRAAAHRRPSGERGRR